MKKTRLKVAGIVLFFLMGVTIFAIGHEMESVAMSAIGSVMSVAMIFIGGDSYRKSDK